MPQRDTTAAANLDALPRAAPGWYAIGMRRRWFTPLTLLATACATTPPSPSTTDHATVVQPGAARLAGHAIGVAYSGYRAGQRPDRNADAREPSDAQLLEDLRLLAKNDRFGLLRLYDAGEHAARVLTLIERHALPLKVMQGAWLQAEASNHEGCPWLDAPIPEPELARNRAANAAELDRLVALARAHPDTIVAINVGNEVLVSWTDHLVPLENLRAHLSRVRAAARQPVSVADNYVAWAEQGPALDDVTDFALVHTYPAWEGKTASEGLAFTIENLERVRAALPEKRMMIGEAGWPTVASEFGPRASQSAQAVYVEALVGWAEAHNVTTFLFEAFDEDWKGNPNDPAGAEKHWGLFDIERRPKRFMQSTYPDLAPAAAER